MHTLEPPVYTLLDLPLPPPGLGKKAHNLGRKWVAKGDPVVEVLEEPLSPIWVDTFETGWRGNGVLCEALHRAAGTLRAPVAVTSLPSL